MDGARKQKNDRWKKYPIREWRKGNCTFKADEKEEYFLIERRR